MAVDQDRGLTGGVQPVRIYHRVAARLGHIHVLHTRGPKIRGDELGRGAAIRCVGRDGGDAGYAEQVLEGLEPNGLRFLEELIERCVRVWSGNWDRHVALRLRMVHSIVSIPAMVAAQQARNRTALPSGFLLFERKGQEGLGSGLGVPAGGTSVASGST